MVSQNTEETSQAINGILENIHQINESVNNSQKQVGNMSLSADERAQMAKALSGLVDVFKV